MSTVLDIVQSDMTDFQDLDQIPPSITDLVG